MEKDDLFEVLKGTIKLISLDQLLQQKHQKLADFCLAYYSAEDLLRLEGRKQMYPDNHENSLSRNPFDYWYSEPTFPAGKKRTLGKRYNTLVSNIHEIKKVRHMLIELAFPDYQDSESEFKVDTITVRKT